jgi:hypothetical protein
MKKIMMTILVSAVVALNTASAAADDHRDEEQGFFGRIWQGTKDVLGIPSNRAEDNDKDNKNKKAKGAKQDRDDDDRARHSQSELMDRLFSNDEKHILREHYGSASSGKQKPLPPGLKKKVERGGELPPGWQKKMARGEVLPEDVYRYGQRLPGDVRRRLPRQPEGTDIIYIDGKVARVIEATRTIVDVFDL